MRTRHNSESGFVLISTMMLAGLFLSMIAAYYLISSIEISTVRFSNAGVNGFYAAEAGLNLRAENIRQVFVGFNRPSGGSPSSTNPCMSGNNGSGDFGCMTYTFNKRSVASYVVEEPSNPVILTIPPGERYQGLNAQEYRYTAESKARRSDGSIESQLQLRFKSRLVPLFQFAAFFNKDLEILPGPNFNLTGPVHTNGNLYAYSQSGTLTIRGQVTAAGDVYRGRKDGTVSPSCNNQPVNVYDPVNPRALIPNCPSRYLVTASDAQPFNGMIQRRVQALTVPGPEVFDPTPGRVYWDRADLRIVLVMNAANNPAGIEVRNANDTNFAAASTTLNACAGQAQTANRAVGTTTIYNFREGRNIRLLDVDLRGVLDCLRSSNWFNTNKLLSDNTEGGLVFHLTIKGGPAYAAGQSPYGVRLRNGFQLRSSNTSAPLPIGFTVVSDQAMYVMGNFNSQNKIPAAVMADSINVLSGAWVDAQSGDAISTTSPVRRVATATTINAAFLSGTDTTGVEGSAGHGGAYSGGLENFPRFHERWTDVNFIYRGSLVSLGQPRHVNGLWQNQSYNPPIRDWDYDTSFNNAANLPPITPRFVYLRQELFVRDFDQ